MERGELLFDGPAGARHTLVFAHGAGAPMDAPWMMDITARLAVAGLRVVRFEFPYMRERRASGQRRVPNPPKVLMSSWAHAIEHAIDDLDAADGQGRRRLLIGGKSMGGRIASMIADEAGGGGLVCLGYPFHPPGRPEKLRTTHLTDLRTPTLILQGTRDPFGRPEEVAEYTLSDAIRVHWLEDGDHSLKPRVKSGRTLEQNLAEAVEQITSFSSSI